MARFDINNPPPAADSEELTRWLTLLCAELKRVLSGIDDENMTQAYNASHPPR